MDQRHISAKNVKSTSLLPKLEELTFYQSMKASNHIMYEPKKKYFQAFPNNIFSTENFNMKFCFDLPYLNDYFNFQVFLSFHPLSVCPKTSSNSCNSIRKCH